MAVPEGPHERLFGREVELRAGLASLSEAQLVTLVGPGGAGKTRLAVEIASRRASADDRVTFVDFRGLTDPGLLPGEMAAALGLDSALADLDDVEGLARAVAGQGSRLLVLDNLEQLTGAADVISRLLAEAPALRVLATSRTPLGIAGERRIAIGPLALPDDDDPATVARSPAVALFLARAGEQGRAITLDELGARDVARLCRRLDGLPLALELAAGRSRLLGPGAILRRLDDPSSSLLMRPGDTGAHGSIAAVLDWSLRLLPEREQRLLGRLAVFLTPVDLATVERVSPGIDTIDALEGLVTSALVRHDERDGEPMFSMLETVRSALLARLEPGEVLAAREAHARRLVDLVESEREALLGPNRAAATAQLERRLDDIRSAVAWALDHDPVAAIRLIAPVWRFWASGVRAREASKLLRDALERETGPTEARAHGLAALAGLGHLREGYGSSRRLAEEAIRIARRVHASGVELDALPGATLAAIEAGDLPAARRWTRRALALARREGDRRAVIRALATMGIAEGRLGDAALGTKHLLAAVAEAREAGDPLNEGIQLANLAELELELDRPRDAATHAATAAAVLRGVRGDTYLLTALAALGQGLAEVGRLREARAALLDAVTIAREAGDDRPSAELLVRALPYLRRTGEAGLAARAWASAAQLAASGRIELTEGVRRMAARELDRASVDTSPWELDRTLRVAAAPPPQDVLVDLGDALARTSPANSVEDRSPFVLTPREAEILRLLGRGLSDAEIAAVAGISAKTASVHVSNVKAKLGVTSRLEAAISGRALLDAHERAITPDA